MSNLQQLQECKLMLEHGLITDADYDVVKSQILMSVGASAAEAAKAAAGEVVVLRLRRGDDGRLGVGLTLSNQVGKLEPAAAEAGLMVGDTIIAIDGLHLHNRRLDDVIGSGQARGSATVTRCINELAPADSYELTVLRMKTLPTHHNIRPRLTQATIARSPGWRAFRFVRDDHVLFTASVAKSGLWLVHKGDMPSTDVEGACALVKRVDGSHFRVEVGGEAALLVHFSVGLRGSCPAEVSVRMADGSVLDSRRPRCNAGATYTLKFFGRATVPCSKNLQLCPRGSVGTEHVSFLLGKTGQHRFSCDWQAPLSSVHAFGMGLVLFMASADPFLAFFSRLETRLSERISAWNCWAGGGSYGSV